MRSEQQITADLDAARAAYHEASETEPAPALRKRESRIRQLVNELSATLSAGAVPCPKCGQQPHGMLKTPAHKQGSRTIPALYEVGCVPCSTRTAPLNANGATPALAVDAWNKLVSQ